MFDLGWTEMLLLVVVALVVIGPKDLPRALRTVGQWVGKARAVAREFQHSVDEMVRESELEDLRKQANSIVNLEDGGSRRATPPDPTGTADGKFDTAAAPPHDIAPVDPATQTANPPDNVRALPRVYTPPAEEAAPEAAEGSSQAAGAGEPKTTR